MTAHDRDLTSREDRDVVIAALVDKAASLGDQVTSLLPRPENLISVGVAILVGAVTLGVTDNHPTIFVLLPFPLILLFVYLVQANTEMLSRAGHKAFLEEKANELLQARGRHFDYAAPARRILVEESDVAKTLHGKTRFGRASIILIQLLLVSLLLLLVGVAIAHLKVVHPPGWKWAFWGALGLGLLTLACSAVELGKAYDRAYEAAQRGFAGEKPTTDPLLKSA